MKKSRKTHLSPQGILKYSGPQGARHIARTLLERYGKNSIEFIIDEGGSEVRNLYGATFALPGTAEKGYFDVKITVSGKGGHSSVPPEHTTIGQLAQIIELIERNPWEPVLTPASRTVPQSRLLSHRTSLV